MNPTGAVPEIAVPEASAPRYAVMVTLSATVLVTVAVATPELSVVEADCVTDPEPDAVTKTCWPLTGLLLASLTVIVTVLVELPSATILLVAMTIEVEALAAPAIKVAVALLVTSVPEASEPA